jgi:fucose 4-O-acetylase-like acetyltransferase
MRDERIDFLRFLGLICIILAHAEPCKVIFQMRNFDVPLMVMVAGLSFRVSFKDETYLCYLWGRVKRLVLPVWLFLSIYFLAIKFAGYPIAMPSTQKIVFSYLLLNGVGYVWIIRVFLLVAIVSPFIYSYSRNQPSNLRYLATVALVYISYVLILLVFQPVMTSGSAIGFIAENTAFYILPYSAVFAIGLRMPELSRKQLATMCFLFFIVFATWIVVHWVNYGKFLPTQAFKYPPQSYYLSYAMLISVMVWSFSGEIIEFLKKLNFSPIIFFFGQNSIWIYLWHIPIVQLVKQPFLVKYPLVLISASVITLIQINIVHKYLLPFVHSATIKRNLRLLLTG